MILNDKIQIDNFKKSIKKIKNKSDKIDYIINKYKENDINFHRIFLSSGYIHSLSKNDLYDIILELKMLKINYIQDIVIDFNCLYNLLNKNNKLKVEIKKFVDSSNNKITINDLFNYLELINFNIDVHRKNILDSENQSLSKNMIYSQFYKILDSFDDIINIIKDNNLNLSKNCLNKYNSNCNKIYISSLLKKQIDSYIQAICLGHYKPIQKDNFIYNDVNYGTIFKMTYNPTYWNKFEINRDLNHNVYYNHCDSSIDLGIPFPIINYYNLEFSSDEELMTTDFKNSVYSPEELYILQLYSSLSHIYGDINNKFKFNNKLYAIKDLVKTFIYLEYLASTHLYKIYKTQSFEKNKDFVTVMGKKQLLRNLNLDSYFDDILNLLSFDLDSNDSSHLIHYKPLIKKDNLYCILPTWISSRSIESCIDKILSNENIVEILFEDNNQKGYMFEDNIESFFKNHNLEFGKVNKDDDNDIDEIDGMFIMDDYLFLFEAKAFIKPNNFIEKYNRLNTELSKAQEQLILRTQMLKESPHKLDIIESRSNLKIKGKKVIPFILTSNSIFNGIKEVHDYNSNNHFPILDFKTLKNIIISKNINKWTYNNCTNTYTCIKSPCISGKDLSYYLYNQYDNLVNIPIQRYALSPKLGVIYPYSIPANINY